MALIPSDVNKEVVHQALDNGKITALDFVPALTHEAIEESTYIVAQMGIEPFQRALEAGAQVVLGGRAYDPACFAALPIMQGFDEGLALHCGKIWNVRPLPPPQVPVLTAQWGLSTTTALR